MPVKNSEVAKILYHTADLLEIEGANTFRVRAYRTAADSIERLSGNLAAMVKEGQPLTNIHGVGEEMAKKIQEIVTTGRLVQLDELEQHIPVEAAELLQVNGLGPRRVQTLVEQLGVKNRKQLRDAAEKGQIRDLPGFGDKLEKNILNDLKKQEPIEKRFRIDKAEEIVEPLLEYIRRSGKVSRLEVAGSFRRRKETVGDLDILAISPSGGQVIDHFVEYEGVDEIIMQGETRSTVTLGSGIHVDLRVVPEESYGAALHYFTGSKPHNLHLRVMAMERDWKINEYGVYQGDKVLAGETEEGIYKLFGIPWIPPELREDNGEIEAAQHHRLPNLIQQKDIRGDLQSHTQASDGKGTLETMAEHARSLGYAYLAITDHSRSLRIAHGMRVEELARQIDKIDRLNEQWEDFRLLKSCEVDILEDGRLDMPDDILAWLDLRVCSIYSHFRLPQEKQTERVLRAMDNPYFNIFAHPTGRLLGKRTGYDIDLQRVLEGAKERGCALEINAHPERLDLDDLAARMAHDMGVMLAISTDAHSPAELDYMRFGVDQARRGWVEPKDVFNTRTWPQLKKLLSRK